MQFAVILRITLNKVSPAELVLGDKLVQPIDHIVEDIPQTFNQKQGSAFAKDLKSRVKSSVEIVNKHLVDSRSQMKKTYDKNARVHPFSIGDRVMLWKPYKRKGVSGCFQPKWHGPWIISKFTGNMKSNCKITDCSNPTKTMNVHVNQLKLINNKHNTNDPHSTQHVNKPVDNILIRPRAEVVDGHPFLHYLKDFEEDFGDAGAIIPEVPHQEVIDNQHEEHVQVRHPQINRRWVEVDIDNIIPEGRARNRHDYNVLAGNRP